MLAGIERREDEFGVAVARGFFAVGGEEVAPAGEEVAGEVLDDRGDGIDAGIQTPAAGVRRAVLGSVSTGLVRSAHSPLVVVPRGSGASAIDDQGSTSPRRIA